MGSKEEVQGRVIKIMPYGAFVKLDEGGVGLIHISQFSNEYVRDAHTFIKEGERVVVKVIGKSKKNGKLNLSFVRKIDGPVVERKHEDFFERKIKKFLRDSEESLSAKKRRLERRKR